MSLDFVVLGQSGAPEKTVSLGVDLHHELITTAAARGLACFQEFEDYYEDAEVSVDDLPAFAEQLRSLHFQADSAELLRFLDDLGKLVVYALAQRKSLYAIAD